MMRRFKLPTAALVAAIAVLVSVSSGASAENLPNHVFDSFNGTSLNTGTWFIDTFQNSGTTQTVHDGSLWLTASSSAASGFHDGLLLAGCQVVGDFDAQMEFTLTTWPSSDNVAIAINAPPLGNTWVQSDVGENVYGLYVPRTDGFGGGQIGAHVRSGALRLIRRGAETSSYFRTDHSRTWQRIGEATGSTAPTFLGLALWNVSNFGGQPVTVEIHSFKLEAAGLAGLNGFPCLL